MKDDVVSAHAVRGGRNVWAVVVCSAALLTAAACGSDDGTGSAEAAVASAVVTTVPPVTDAASTDPSTSVPVTDDEFCVEAAVLNSGDDSGPYSEFYDLHPDPTLEDVAKDGHLVTDNIQDIIDMMSSWQPSPAATPMLDEALAAFEVLKQNSIDSIAAAAAGDQAEVDRLEQVNQDTNVPAVMAALTPIADLCGFSNE